MKLWDITLTCDHKMLVAAPTADEAIAIANREAKGHDTFTLASPLPNEQPVEVQLDKAGLIVWYPGPFSEDAIIDEEDKA